MTVDNFVGSLVEMAKAYERMPAMEAELRQVQEHAGTLAETVAAREESILRLKAEIEQLHAKQRELEVSRDEAQFHALEADDRTQRALDFIKATFGNAGALIQALEPPAVPESVSKPMEGFPGNPLPGTFPADGGLAAPDVGERAVGEPTTYGSPSTTDHVDIHSSASSAPAPEVAAQPGEPNANTEAPSPSVLSSTEPTAVPSVSSDGASPDAPTVDPSAKPVGPYTGRRYSDVVKGGEWPTRDQWEAGGGTVDNWFA